MVIQVDHLTATYDDRIVLDNLSMNVKENEILVVLGRSGCGKSTFLKHLIKLLIPIQGRIEILDQEITQLSEEAYRGILRRIGVMFQNGALLNSLTVLENVTLPLEMHTDLPQRMIEDIARLKLHQVGLSHAAARYPKELSGGMVKRAAIARAIVLDPKILFCDEPSAGLDPVTALHLDELLLNLRNNLSMTLVIVTHELKSIERIADRILMLDEGKVLFQGSMKEALKLNHPKINEFFLVNERT